MRIKTEKKTQFRDLAIGETFRFTSETEFPHSGMKTGLCEKISRRKYRYVEDGMECTVGSWTCTVRRTAE